MTLKGWHQPLPQAAINAINQGTIKVITVTIKGVEVELLQGSYVDGGMVREFK